MSSEARDDIPIGWILCRSKSNPGREYYFNRKTGESLWSRPGEDNKEDSKDNTMGRNRKNMKRKSGEGSSRETTEPAKKQKTTNAKPAQPAIIEAPKPKPRNSPRPKCRRKQLPKSIPKPTTSRETPTTSSRPTKTTSPKKIPESKSKKVPTPDINQTPSPKNAAERRLLNLRSNLEADVKTSKTIKHTPSKPPETQTTPKPPPKPAIISNWISPSDNTLPSQSPKNSASKRLSNLRSKLEVEANITGNQTNHTNDRSSASPNDNSPPPSQFLAVNKIISSIKSLLPERYACKDNRNRFDDIEKVIKNHASEYSTRLPTTPPQFSEANKIVDAIKSKLQYRSPVKDYRRYSSVSEQFELHKPVIDDLLNKTDSAAHGVYRQLEERKQIVEPMVIDVQPVNSVDNSNGSMKNPVLVVDTNLFIHDLDFIKTLVNSHIKGYEELPTLLVPWRVINELDRLKDSNKSEALCKRARAAMDYLYQSLPEKGRIKGQPLRDANSHIYPCEVFDDEILNCCLQQAERGNSVMLVSNDKNLCNKAVINNVRSIGLADLKKLLSVQCCPELLAGHYSRYQTAMYDLLANIYENEMRAKFDTLSEHLLFKAPPWTLLDVLRFILKHWFSVFSEVFPVKRVEPLIEDMKSIVSRIDFKGVTHVTQSDVDSFKKTSLEVATICQILPEYMELAKSTIKKLNCTEDEGPGEVQDNEMVVIEAFENVWTVFSSYCAKLATGLGVSHSLEDKLPCDDSLEVLKSRWAVFSKQIQTLSLALKGAVSVHQTDSSFSDQINNLELVFKECLSIIHLNTTINKDNLKFFCCNCRNMLQEAYTKFSQLTDLLVLCSQLLINE